MLQTIENSDNNVDLVFISNWFLCWFEQAMEGSYIELANKLAGSGVKVGKFNADGDRKEYAKQELQLGSFPTIILISLKHASKPIKYTSEKRDVDGFCQCP